MSILQYFVPKSTTTITSGNICQKKKMNNEMCSSLHEGYSKGCNLNPDNRFVIYFFIFVRASPEQK